jgi:Domain of unknown function (DUF427)
MLRAVWKGAVLAESEDTVKVEGNHYFPAESLHREYFAASPATASARGRARPGTTTSAWTARPTGTRPGTTRSRALLPARSPGMLRSGHGVRVERVPGPDGEATDGAGRGLAWASRPRLCCWGTPAYMHAATEQPSGLSGFRLVPQTGQDGVEVWFRAPAGRVPDVLGIGLHGRRRPRVEAYWDGCQIAL